MSTFACPDGHRSADPQWCDTCGAPIGGSATGAARAPQSPAPAPASDAAASPVAAPAAPAAPVTCPSCGEPSPAANLFCESCGYDFTTGQLPAPVAIPAPGVAHGSAGPLTASGPGHESPVVDLTAAPDPFAPVPDEPAGAPWVVVIEVDPLWFALKGELADRPCPAPSTSTVTITAHTSLIGRSSHSRGVHPEIALDADSAVSRRHAQLVIDGGSLSVIDLSSTNGTYVVRAGGRADDDLAPIQPGVAVELGDGDHLQLGAWTRLTVRTR